MLEESGTILKRGSTHTERLQEGVSKLVSFGTLAEHNENRLQVASNTVDGRLRIFWGGSSCWRLFKSLGWNGETKEARWRSPSRLR